SMLPDVIVRPKDDFDIQNLFKYAKNTGKSITFRASGTSLSGQTVSNGIIAEIAYDWQKIQVKNNGKSILLEPGAIGEHANQNLREFQRRIGPDPASIKSARIGGIVANNASGMTTGKSCNSYNTLKDIRFILSNGNIYDTSNKQDYDKFIVEENELSNGLIAIRDELSEKEILRNKILNKYRIKNTIGYSLNSFLDFNHSLDIFAHLLIGSEGTLAFISNIELKTVLDPQFKSTGLVLFPSIKMACSAINPIKDTSVKALELMDYASLKTAKYLTNVPYDINSLPQESAALLFEFQEDKKYLLNDLEKKLSTVVKNYHGSLIGNVEKEENARLKLWRIRKSLFTTVGSLRKLGTSVITEDICFDIENLSDAVTDLHRIFTKWKYDDAVIFGHAKDGNLHFVASIDLDSKEGIARYRGMLGDIAKITIDKFTGSLKAEHGTGRNMAPFVEREWGSDLYKVMWKIKNLSDPNNILNPGVILNRNNNIHIENLKPMPAVNAKIDLCVECGFCEQICPSRGFTFTPRQRISVCREMEIIRSKKSYLSKKLKSDYFFSTAITCAVDGMCETVCPVNINTGEFVKDLRSQHNYIFGKFIANLVSNHFRLSTITIKFALKILNFNTKVFGSNFINSTFHWLNKISKHHIPALNSMITSISKSPEKMEYGTGKLFIYYPSCISRAFSADSKNQSIIEVMGQIAELTKIKLIIPDKIGNTCCSTPFSSKGYHETGVDMFERTINLLYDTSKGGKIPIVVDTSPCTYKFLHSSDGVSKEIYTKWKKLKFVDIIPFLNSVTNTENIKHKPLNREIVVYPTCSTQKMEHTQILKSLAQRCAKNVTTITNSGCCGFAGDRGMIVPQLTKNAVKINKDQLASEQRKLNGYSSSRMCEIGMSDSEQSYMSIALLVRDYLISNSPYIN
ncbi:MAG: FAD-binding and (Fe-S)-binding domain-containing protein, partial [Candidatus Neomarinimicrobiota bacterium]